MNSLHKILVSTVALSTIAACGGGGDDDNSGSATGPSGPRPFTQNEVRFIAADGALATTLVAGDYGSAGLFTGGTVLQSFAADAGGTRVVDLRARCTSGTLTAAVTKPTPHTGILVGDQVVLTYDRCAIGTVVVSGNLTMTPRTALVSRPAGDVDVTFGAQTSGLTVTSGGTVATVEGIVEAKASLANLNLVGTTFTVPAGQQWKVNLSGSTTLKSTFAAGTTSVITNSLSPSSGTRKLDGSVILTNPTGTEQYVITTPTALSGTSNSGDFVPTSGASTSKAVSINLATATTFSGNTVTVTGDTDRNGSLDLRFTTTWEALNTP